MVCVCRVLYVINVNEHFVQGLIKSFVDNKMPFCRQQDAINQQKEEIEKKKKSLAKRRPPATGEWTLFICIKPL
jgi:hypothetical protein